ncbi:MAG: Gfo/Idh/MocA family oxidoreductase [Bacteroidaceae bacterium]|nr:Gfo/Idh/MocA family oxidoreductase [Bacteroidaceae bacterium]
MTTIGVIGTGKIVGEVLEMLRQERLDFKVNSIYAHSNVERARRLADTYNINKVYTDYETLLSEDRSDMLYIANVNDQHFPYAQKALQSGRNVIIEKPICLKAKELDTLITVARDRHLYIFEAMTLRFAPNFIRLKEDVKKLGKISIFEANYSQYSSRYDQYKQGIVLPAFDPAHAGGALLDLNIYNITFVVSLFGMPEQRQYYPNRGFNGVDTSGVMILQYPDFTAVCTAAKDADGDSHITIEGENGFIRANGVTSVCREYELHLRGEQPVVVKEQKPSHRLSYEFRRFSEIYEQGDYSAMTSLLNQTRAAIESYTLE